MIKTTRPSDASTEIVNQKALLTVTSLKNLKLRLLLRKTINLHPNNKTTIMFKIISKTKNAIFKCLKQLNLASQVHRLNGSMVSTQ